MSANQHAKGRFALLVADTDETQSYVFESNKLPEIRGASRQLDELNGTIGKQVEAEGDCIFAGGGSLLAIVERSAAADLVRQIEAAYPERTGVATISAAFRSLPEDYQNHDFGEYVRWAGHWLRQHKESKSAPSFVETLPFQSVCSSCHIRPANAAYLDVLPDSPICTICYEKRQSSLRRGRDAKTWYGEFRKWLATRSMLERADYYGRYEPDEIEIPQTVSEIGRASFGRSGYVGFVYLDGDSIGQLLTRLKSVSDYTAVSKALTTTTEHAVYQALAAELRPTSVTGSELRKEIGQTRLAGQPVLIHPFEIITIGGDDVLLIVPAHAAIPIAQRIGRVFGDEVTQVVRRLPGLSKHLVMMSAGVVFADDHTPVQMQYQLAKELLKLAKRTGGALDFHVLKSADMVDRNVSNLREQHPYTLKGAGDKLKNVHLLARPYTHEQAGHLWEGLRELKRQNFATSQMHLLAQALLDGRQQGTLFYLYQQRRQRRAESRAAFETLESTLVKLQGQNERNPPPWRALEDVQVSHDTALWDIAELYDFVAF